MKLAHLIANSQINEATSCGIHNTLLKYRPDLKDEMDAIPGRDVNASTDFLRDHGLWDEHAQKLLESFLMWNREYMRGPDEETKKHLMKRMNELMCHVAKLIRQSVVRENADPASQFAQQLMQKYGDLGLKSLRMNMDTRHEEPVVELSDIWVDQQVQGRGVGTQVMQDIADWADQNKALIWLSLGDKDQGRGTTSQARLGRFYRQFGFKPNKGRGKRFDLSMYAQMYREPR